MRAADLRVEGAYAVRLWGGQVARARLLKTHVDKHSRNDGSHVELLPTPGTFVGDDYSGKTTRTIANRDILEPWESYAPKLAARLQRRDDMERERARLNTLLLELGVTKPEVFGSSLERLRVSLDASEIEQLHARFAHLESERQYLVTGEGPEA